MWLCVVTPCKLITSFTFISNWRSNNSISSRPPLFFLLSFIRTWKGLAGEELLFFLWFERTLPRCRVCCGWLRSLNPANRHSASLSHISSVSYQPTKLCTLFRHLPNPVNLFSFEEGKTCYFFWRMRIWSRSAFYVALLHALFIGDFWHSLIRHIWYVHDFI